jgi:hypothetical protein
VSAQRRESERARLESSDRLAAVRDEISGLRDVTDRLDTDVAALRAAVGRCPLHDGSGGALVPLRNPKRGTILRLLGGLVTAIGGWWATHTRPRGTVSE